jgi:hypothetical protein
METLCNNGFSTLKNYLLDVKDHCPEDYFQKGPRSSALRMGVDVDVKKVRGHEVSELARLGLESNKFKTAHSNVQVFMLQHDNKTISLEVPIWLLETELSNYTQLFDSHDPLTGHIDALRVEDGNIWIWDYKPNAAKERYASTQTNFYALMLSQRTGISLNKFRCGYFDDTDAFMFKPISNINPLLKPKP